MSPPRSLSPRLSWGLLILSLLALLWWHAAIVAPFAISLVLAYALHPAVDRLCAWRWPRSVAAGVSLLLLVLVGFTVLVLLVPIVSQLTPMLRNQLPDLLVSWCAGLTPWLSQWGIDLPNSPDEIKAQVVDLIQLHATDWGGAVWRSVLIGGGGLVSLAGLAVLVPMLAFYWLLYWHRLTGKFRDLLPARWRPDVHDLLAECDELIGQYLRGQSLVMVILAGYYSVALSLIGFKLALPIGVFTGLAVCIPYLGYGLGLTLALMAGILQYGAAQQGVGYAVAIVAAVYGFGQVLESFFLTPRLVGERIGLHPLGVILSLMLFGQWMGLWGIVIALPVSALAMVLGRRALSAYRSSSFFSAT
jgi:predicted PurR-regulated permease PerM